ncbi:hypothetical protein HKX48_004800 [Thoreauomyces humboldtii]|nr:hypothetical protein HKX48_004800 [Thoreauomyces humboldtii]
MVARKREQVSAVSATAAALPGASKLSKTKSSSSLAGTIAKSDSMVGGMGAGMLAASSTQGPAVGKARRKVSLHASLGTLWGPEAVAQPSRPPMPPRALPSLTKMGSGLGDDILTGNPHLPVGVPRISTRPGSAGKSLRKTPPTYPDPVPTGRRGLRPASAGRRSTSSLADPQSSGRMTHSLSHNSSLGDLAGPDAGGTPPMSIEPAPLPVDKGRPGSGGRRYPSHPGLPGPRQTEGADVEDDDTTSNISRSARTSIGSMASDTSTLSRRRTSSKADLKALRKPQKAAVKKRQFQPALELPRWNTSTRAIIPLAKVSKGSKTSEGGLPRSRSREGLDDSLSRRQSKKGQSSADIEDEAADVPEDSMQTEVPDEDDYQEQKYPVTPYQLNIFVKTCPTQDDLDSNVSLYTGPPFYISVGYHLPSSKRMRVADLARAVKRVCTCYIVLQTRFYRNDRIVDADVEGLLDRREWRSVDDDEVVEAVDMADWEGPVNERSVSSAVRRWMLRREKFERTFSALLMDASMAPKPGTGGSWVVFVASTAVADALSCNWVGKEILKLYDACDELRTTGQPDDAIDALIDAYEPREHYDFVAFAYEMEAKATRHAMTYWKEQCVEVVQEHVNPVEKADIITKLARLERERDPLRAQIVGLRKRKADLENDMQGAVAQRKRLEVPQQDSRLSTTETPEPGNGPVVRMTYTDPTTNELHVISPETQATIIQTIFGESAPTSGPGTTGIGPLLTKHDVAADVQESLMAVTPTLELFAGLTDTTVTDLGLGPKERRQIMALVEYVRNRIAECLQEEGKLKHSIERRIAKYSREAEAAADALRTAVDALDANEDWALRMELVIRPPYVETKIPNLLIEPHVSSPEDTMHAEDTDGQESGEGLAGTLGFVPLALPPEILSNLRLFQTSYRASARVRRSTVGTPGDGESPTTPGGYSSTDAETSAGVDDGGSAPLGTRGHASRTSARATVLTAFAILLKHITGSDRFLLGFVQSFRRNGLLVGPVTDTFPLKVDLTRKGCTFTSVFSQLARAATQTRRYGAACPMAKIATELDLPRTAPPVQFEYVSFRDAEVYRAAGLSPEALLPPSARGADAAVDPSDPLWVVDETDPCAFKLMLVETATELRGGFVFRNDTFKQDQVVKWADKLVAILDGVDTGARQVPVASIISRFYQSLWQGGGSSSSAQVVPTHGIDDVPEADEAKEAAG